MKSQIRIAALLLAPVGAVFAYQEKKAAEAVASKDDPMMMKMKEFATPGPAHKVLDGIVGKWTAQVKTWMEPGKNPESSTGSSETKWIFGGRYIQDDFTGTFMGQPFQGHGITGFDNLKKKYISSWIDSAGTGMMVSEGTFDAGTKTFTYTGECPDCMAGKYVKSRSVTKMTDADHWTMQMFSPGPDGKEFMCMQIDYTRAK